MILLIKIILSIILSNRIDKINSLTKSAEESFRKENYNESIINYRLLIDSFDYSNEKLYLNLAHSHLLSKDTLNAIENYNYASLTDNMKIKSIALQQLGNINVKKNKLEEALNFYKESIIADNTNNDSKFNFELVKKKIDNQKENKEENSQKQNSKDKNKDKSSENKKNDEKGKEDEKNQNENKEQNNSKDQNQKNSEESLEDKLKKINMSKKKAEMILNALNNNEFQYIQQLKRKSNKKSNKNKPDW